MTNPQAKTPPSERENLLFDRWRALPVEDRGPLTRELLSALRDHAGRVCWMILRRNSPDLIEDVVLQILYNIDKFSGQSKFSTWVHANLKNRCYNERRNQRIRKEVPLASADAVTTDPTFEQEVVLNDLIAQLDEQDQQLIRMRLSGMRLEEIGEQVGLSWAGVRKRLTRVVGSIASGGSKIS